MPLEPEGLLLGLDIQNNSSQVCFYQKETQAVQTVMFPESGSVFLHPTELRNLFEQSDDVDVLEEKISSLTSYLIDQGRKAAGSQRIAQIGISISCYQPDILFVFTNVMNKQLFTKNQWILISHEEAYAYYAFSQKKELYQAGVMLLDYQKDGLHTYYMKNVKADGIEYILEDRRDFKQKKLIQAAEHELRLSDVSELLIKSIREAVAARVITSIYLTGPGFDTDDFPDELTHELCNRRKAFAGQNLYVRGACCCACEEVTPGRFKNTVFGCENRITTGIEVDILEREQSKRLRVVRPGTNWFMAERSMDFILDDVRQITLLMRPCDKRPDYEINIDISEIPFRDGRRTRINLHIQFQSEEQFIVTVTDKGFGDFVPASGKVIKKEFSLSIKESDGNQL